MYPQIIFFDGDSQTPYIENDKTNPLGVYGKTKLEGKKVINVAPNVIIVRTAWFFSEYGNNFVKTMLKHGENNDTLSVVDDQIGCPTYAGDIANAILHMLNGKAPGGIYHYCGNI